MDLLELKIMKRKIRFGFVGTGRISDWVLKGAFLDPRFKLEAVCSRSKERADAFAARYGVKKTFTDIKEMASCPTVDAIYIGTPNATHKDLAIKAMNCGKAVLCEKPMASNAAEVREMTAAAKANGVLLMEAMISTLNPNFKEAVRFIDEIAPIRHWSSAFCQYSARYEKLLAGEVTNVFNPAMAGGAIMDIGVYTIYPMVRLFGKPESLTASMRTIPLPDGSLTDVSGSIQFSYPGMHASVIYSKTDDSFLPTEIAGEKGNILLDQIHITRKAEYIPHAAPASGRGLPPERQDITCSMDGDEYQCEFREFIDLLTYGKKESAINTLQTSLTVMEIIDEARRQNGITYPADKL